MILLFPEKIPYPSLFSPLLRMSRVLRFSSSDINIIILNLLGYLQIFLSPKHYPPPSPRHLRSSTTSTLIYLQKLSAPFNTGYSQFLNGELGEEDRTFLRKSNDNMNTQPDTHTDIVGWVRVAVFFFFKALPMAFDNHIFWCIPTDSLWWPDAGYSHKHLNDEERERNILWVVVVVSDIYCG